jgi:hypothetical protein
VAAEFIAHRRQHLFGKCMLSGLERKRTNKAAVNTSAEIASSIAAWIVRQPSAESCTTPVYLVNAASSAKAPAVRSRSQEPTTLPRRQSSAISAALKIVATPIRQHVALSSSQNVEPFGISLHDAVFDPVVNHLTT